MTKANTVSITNGISTLLEKPFFVLAPKMVIQVDFNLTIHYPILTVLAFVNNGGLFPLWEHELFNKMEYSKYTLRLYGKV